MVQKLCFPYGDFWIGTAKSMEEEDQEMLVLQTCFTLVTKEFTVPTILNTHRKQSEYGMALSCELRYVRPELVKNSVRRRHFQRSCCSSWPLVSDAGDWGSACMLGSLCCLNHRMAWIGGNLKNHPVPNPCHGQGCHSLDQVVWGIIMGAHFNSLPNP